MMIERRTTSSEETESLAAAIAGALRGGELLALSGSLGSGKTTFVRGLARGLEIPPDQVSSPTYVICHEYEAPDRLRLIHIDAYRLQDESELETIGWDEMLKMPDAVIAVEWPQRISDALPDDHLHITFEAVADQERLLTLIGAQYLLDRIDTAIREPRRKCPTCGQAVSTASTSYPFCSSRCRMADLGQWFSESYRVSRPSFTEEDDDELF